MTAERHWRRWHDEYLNPGSPISRRLAVVQRRLGEALDRAPAGPLRIVSMCAGQGRDVIGVLRGHPRRADVAARLVELDPGLAGDARESARNAGLADIEVLVADAGDASSYAGAVPAAVVVVCGVFGNVSDADVRRTIEELPALCAEGATVIWTRHRRPPDLTPTVRAWFVDAGFEELAFDTEEGAAFSVGTARLVGAPRPLLEGVRMFSFVGDGADAHH